MPRYAATIFLSAFLLFLVQPLIGKYILPWFGGGSGVWTACLLFFQTALLLGYAYAHAIVRWFSPRSQMIVHLLVLAGGLLMLPIVPREAFKPSDSSQPVLRIVILLTMTIGLPYLALASTGPLLQAWFARERVARDGGDRSVYRLYALSNLGSLLALLGYPFAMEPALARTMQAYVWSAGFVLFALLCGWCAIRQRGVAAAREFAAPPRPATSAARSKAKSGPPTIESRPVSGVDRAMWVVLPMCASIMLLATTTQLTEEIAPMPFIWVLPLAIYLVTFILAFEWPSLYDRRVFGVLALASPWIVLWLLSNVNASLPTQAALMGVALFAVCMVCHGETYRLRPPPQQLTGFYLAIAFGGAAGGAFVALLAPRLFNSNIELYLALFGSIGLLALCIARHAPDALARRSRRPVWLGMLLISAFAGYLIRERLDLWNVNTAQQARNFYGSLRVRVFEDNPAWRYMKLEHGRIAHGAQALDPDMRRRPLMYYSPDSGVGLAMSLLPEDRPWRIGVVGLGTGSMAAYGRAGDLFRFYEINPEVEALARDPFTYLADSPATIEVALGDARQTMERERTQEYDLIVLDAFSGDAVPLHLLTREAFATYRRHLKPTGLIAVHVTNRYLDLDRVVQQAAGELGMSSVFVLARARELPDVSTSLWTLITSDPTLLASRELSSKGVRAPDPSSLGQPWTDDHCSILDALR